jgi:hypothetical protein
MEQRETSLTYLQRLADELKACGFTVEVARKVAKPYLQVANAATPSLNERVVCAQDSDGSWMFWWPWKQPIGPADDLETVAGKVAAVVRSVEEI